MSKKVDINQVYPEVAAELSAYCQEVTDALKEEIEQVAAETLKEVKQNAPKRTGKYRRSWRKKVMHESAEDIRIRIFNKKFPGLTHLLEDGHAKVNGGRVAGIPHIKPAEEHAAEKLVNRVKVKLR